MFLTPPQQTVTDMANRDLSNELNRTHRRVGAVIKRVETLVQEVEELRQTQEALVARVGVTATTGRVDPVAVSAVEGKIERLRGEVSRLENRAETGMATMQSVLRDTVPGTKLLEQEQNAVNQSEFYVVKERLRMCEDQVAVLTAVKQQTLDTGKVERPDTNVPVSYTHLTLPTKA